jgi:hypothetical protein
MTANSPRTKELPERMEHLLTNKKMMRPLNRQYTVPSTIHRLLDAVSDAVQRALVSASPSSGASWIAFASPCLSSTVPRSEQGAVARYRLFPRAATRGLAALRPRRGAYRYVLRTASLISTPIPGFCGTGTQPSAPKRMGSVMRNCWVSGVRAGGSRMYST